MLRLAHSIRLRPNVAQSSYFRCAAGISRFAYNWALARWNELYTAGAKPNAHRLNAELNAIKSEQFPWMRDVSKCVAQQGVLTVGDAFAKFFTKKACYPRFKKKGVSRDSFYLSNDHVVIVGNQIRIPKLGWVRMEQTVRFPGRVLSVTISREADHWYASVLIEIDESWVYPHRCESQAVVGIDLGVTSVFTLSDGTKMTLPRELKRLDRRLRREQRFLSRKQKDSRNRERAKVQVARTYARMKHVRQDFLHKETTKLARNFRRIGVEDLNVRGMVRNHCLAKSISERCFGEIYRQLAYKTKLAGGVLVTADRFFASSKTCSACGYVLDELPLSVREWVCPKCGVTHDRDVNAAQNLEMVAVRYTETENACGEIVSPPPRRRCGRRRAVSLKQECHPVSSG